MVIPLSPSTILSGVETAQVGMDAGIVTIIQTVGNAVGMTVVDMLLFLLLGQAERAEGAMLANAVAHVAHYGHTFAPATLYNVTATVLSFVLLWRTRRRHA